MENIDSDLLLNYYFKDGYMFSCPSRFFYDKDEGASPDFDEAFSLAFSEDLEPVDLDEF